MFGIIKKVFSILFILVVYFVIITFFSLAQANNNSVNVCFDQLFPVSPIEKINKILSYQFQFIRNYQSNEQTPEEFNKFLDAMFNSAVDLTALLFELEKTNLPKDTDLNQFLNTISYSYQDLTKNHCDSQKVIAVKVLLQEANNRMQLQYQS